MHGFERFIDAQEQHYQLALEEVRAGKKQGHWICGIYSLRCEVWDVVILLSFMAYEIEKKQ